MSQLKLLFLLLLSTVIVFTVVVHVAVVNRHCFSCCCSCCCCHFCYCNRFASVIDVVTYGIVVLVASVLTIATTVIDIPVAVTPVIGIHAAVVTTFIAVPVTAAVFFSRSTN